jgi:hypothetical protein
MNPTRTKLPTRILDIARCPRCGYPLVARLTVRGPRFPCVCAEPPPVAGCSGQASNAPMFIEFLAEPLHFPAANVVAGAASSNKTGQRQLVPWRFQAAGANRG